MPQIFLLINNFREKSKSPRSKKEVVEEELDETIKALEKQVNLNLLSKQQPPHPSVTTTAGLGSSVVILMMTNSLPSSSSHPGSSLGAGRGGGREGGGGEHPEVPHT